MTAPGSQPFLSQSFHDPDYAKEIIKNHGWGSLDFFQILNDDRNYIN
jgi:hypothetical protein